MTGPRGRALITGGAGFIGSHLADLLLEQGYEVRILDALLPQVHPSGWPDYLSADVECQKGDVRDAEAMARALAGSDVVFHLAAAVGVGQSMYEMSHYSSVNVMGTANLLEVMVRAGSRPRRLVVASSMSIYGEGLYNCARCGDQEPRRRPAEQLARREWAVRCPGCDTELVPRPTPEDKTVHPTSVYAINKRDQEEMVLTVAASLSVPAVALRFFNVYGPRQALSNPYTGVAAIFSSALLNGRPPIIFEDGRQLRDLTHVTDIARACLLAAEREGVADQVFNVGTGAPRDLLDVLRALQEGLGPAAQAVQPQILGQYRVGDIRACFADVTRARTHLGFEAQVPLEQGMRELAAWVAAQKGADHRAAEALSALQQHNLIH